MDPIVKIDKTGSDLIKQFEGCSLKAYKCPAGIWTIGYGNTFYANGKRVKEGDTINKQEAEVLLYEVVKPFEFGVNSFTRDDISQNQFNALVSFAYNVGLQNLKNSTLLKKVNANPLDQTIKNEFLKWNKAAGKVLNGLTARRTAEAELYFK